MSNELYIMHYGVGHDKGGHSGRYPWGSGDNPKQDEKKLKNELKSNIRNAEKMNKRMRGNVIWRGNETALHFKSKGWIFGSLSKIGLGGSREGYKTAIRKYYNQNATFRNEVKDAKKAWLEAGRKNAELARSYVNHYKNNKLAKSNGYYVQDSKAKDYVDIYANKVKKYSSVDDIEFATRYLYDDQVTKNKIAVGIVAASLLARIAMAAKRAME